MELQRRYGKRPLKPLSSWPRFGQFGMSPFLLHVLENRPDLVKTFDVQTPEGLWHANAWLYTHGLHERDAMSLVDAQVIRALDRVPPFFLKLIHRQLG
jgi:hypothetical protein